MKIPTEIAVVETTEVELPAETSKGFGVIYPTEKPEEEKAEDKHEDDTEEKYIQAKQLAMNRVSERGISTCEMNTQYFFNCFNYALLFSDRKELPVFKNYQAGVPSRRLYIKNLAKDVTPEDLNFIFRRYYVKGIDEQGTMYVFVFFVLCLYAFK